MKNFEIFKIYMIKMKQDLFKRYFNVYQLKLYLNRLSNN